MQDSVPPRTSNVCRSIAGHNEPELVENTFSSAGSSAADASV